MQNERNTKENVWKDANERNRLVEENVGLIYMVLKRFGNRGYDMEELFQVGSIGLLKAVDRFEAERGLAFSTYAVPLIIGEIKRFLRDDGMIHINRQIKENARKIAIMREQYKKTENKEPTMEEIGNALGMNREDVIMAIASEQTVASIHQPVGGSQDDSTSTITVEEQLGDDRCEQDAVLNRLAVQQLLSELDEQSKKLIVLRYKHGMTQMQTAKHMGMNQVAVSRLEKKILLQLRERI